MAKSRMDRPISLEDGIGVLKTTQETKHSLDLEEEKEWDFRLEEVDSLRHQVERQLEFKFRERYAALKQIYESRLHKISRVVRDVDLSVEHDPVLNTMKLDAVTAPFVPARSQEIAEDALADEREDQIAHLAEELSEKYGEVASLKQELSSLSQKVKSQQVVISQAQRENFSLKAAKDRMDQEAAERENVWAQNVLERENEQKTFQSALLRLRRLVKKISLVKLDHAKALHEEELENESEDLNTVSLCNVIERKLKSIFSEHVSSKEKEREVQDLRQKLQLVESKHSETVRIAKAAKEELSRAQVALEKSECERIELREQYMLVGSKLERVISTHDEQARKDSVSYRARLEEAESRSRTLIKSNEQLHSELSRVRLDLERQHHKIEDMQAKHEHQVRVMLEREQVVESNFQKELETEKIKTKHTQERFDEYKTEVSQKLHRSQADATSYLGMIQAEREKWEREKDHQLKEYQLKLEGQFQKLLESKESEIKSAIAARDQELHRHAIESDRVEDAVAKRIHSLLREHIPLTQHREILESYVAQSQERNHRVSEDWRKQASEELKEAIRSTEGRLTSQFQAQLDAVNREKELLEQNMNQIRREKDDLSRMIDSERRSMVKYRKQYEDSEARKAVLKKSLDESLRNLSKLKSILETEREKHSQIETSLKVSNSENIKRLQNQLVELDDEKRRLETKFIDKESIVSQLDDNKQQEISRLRSELESVRSEMISIKDRAAARELELSSEWSRKCENDLGVLEASLRHEMEIQKMRFESKEVILQNQIKDVTTELQQAQATYTTSVESHLEVKEDLRKCQRDLETARETVSSLNVVKVELHGELTRTKKAHRKAIEKCGANHRAHRALFLSVQALKSEYKSFASESERSIGFVLRFLIENLKDLGFKHNVHSERTKANLAKLESSRDAVVQGLERKVQKLHESLQESTTWKALKDQEESEALVRLAESSQSVQALESELAAVKCEAKASEQKVEELSRSLDLLSKAESELSSAVVAEREKTAEMDKQLQLQQNHLLSLLATIRDIVPLPETIMDKLVDPNKFTGDVLVYLHKMIKDWLLEQVKSRSNENLDPIQKQISKMSEMKNSLEKKLRQREDTISHLERKLDEAVKKSDRMQLDLQNCKEESLRKDKQCSMLDLQVSQLRQAVAAVEEDGSLMDQMYKRRLECVQANWKAKLEKEKLRNRSLREEVLTGSFTNEIHELRFSGEGPLSVHSRSSALEGGTGRTTFRSQSPRRQAVKEETGVDVNNLLERSRNLDSAAQRLLDSSNERSSGFAAHSNKTANARLSAENSFSVSLKSSPSGAIKSIRISSPRNKRQ